MIEGWKIRKVRDANGDITFREVFHDETGKLIRIAKEPFFATGRTVRDLFDSVDLQMQAYALDTLTEGDEEKKG